MDPNSLPSVSSPKLVPSVEEMTPTPPPPTPTTTTPPPAPVVTATNDSQSKKIGRRGVIALGVASLFILVGGVVGGVLLSRERQDVTPGAFEDETAEILPTQTLPFPTSPGHKYIDLPASVTLPATELWPNADDTLNPAPTKPQDSELRTVYEQTRKAIDEREYGQFQDVASAERVWHIQHPKNSGGESVMGRVWVEANYGGEAAFNKLAPFAYTFWAPPVSDVEFVESVLNVSDGTMFKGDTVVLLSNDKKSGKVYKTNYWKYEVVITTRSSADSNLSATGYIVFVYDEGRWAYNGESWQSKVKEGITSFGTEVALGSAGLVEINGSSTTACASTTTTVSSGQTVKWENVDGVIYGLTSPEEKLWSSGYAKGNYQKVFITPGDYTYVIRKISQEPSEEVCKINVK